jgi:hypothetical protein
MENINRIAEEKMMYSKSLLNETEHIEFYKAVCEAIKNIEDGLDIIFYDMNANFIRIALVENTTNFLTSAMMNELIDIGKNNNFTFIGIQFSDNKIYMEFVKLGTF